MSKVILSQRNEEEFRTWTLPVLGEEDSPSVSCSVAMGTVSSEPKKTVDDFVSVIVDVSVCVLRTYQTLIRLPLCL